jgi:hypothetical protein
MHIPFWKAPPTLSPKVFMSELSPMLVPCHSTYMVFEKKGYHHPFYQINK